MKAVFNEAEACGGYGMAPRIERRRFSVLNHARVKGFHNCSRPHRKCTELAGESGGGGSLN